MEGASERRSEIPNLSPNSVTSSADFAVPTKKEAESFWDLVFTGLVVRGHVWRIEQRWRPGHVPIPTGRREWIRGPSRRRFAWLVVAVQVQPVIGVI